MKLSHQTTLDDLLELAARRYRRRRAYRINYGRNLMIWTGVFAFFGLLGFRNRTDINLPLLCAAAGAWGAAIHHFTYDRSVRRHLRKHLAQDIGDALPCTTDYHLEDGRLLHTSRGVTTSFTLADLTGIDDATHWLELAFGDQDLCVIPQRAFSDAAEKSAFLDAVRAHTSTRFV